MAKQTTEATCIHRTGRRLYKRAPRPHRGMTPVGYICDDCEEFTEYLGYDDRQTVDEPKTEGV